jgi:ABC-type sugar transport system substrate-binding protein
LIARNEFGATVLAAVDSRGLTGALRKAKAAGIAVILVEARQH